MAPFWADTDTRPIGSGRVYYQFYCSVPGGAGCANASTVLDRARLDVRTAFCDPEFAPAVVLVATWFEVGYYNQRTDKVRITQY